MILFLALAASIASAQSPQKTEDARNAANDWLALVDSGKYADSWQQAASLFQSHVSQDQWESTIRAAREPLGKVVSRDLKSAAYTTSLPGAPDGEYVVIQYNTVFEHKKAAVETIIPMLDKNAWKVSGYFIK
jgi:hypothetical protein